MNYLSEFKKADEAFHLQNYDSCIRISGKLVETGLKDLYKRQEEWYNSKNQSFDLASSFSETHKGFENFSISRSGLSRLLQFYHLSGMWDEVRVRVNSNLHFTQRIPWRHLRCVRNDATHGSESLSREHAVEFLHHLKVFMYECELAEDLDEIKPDFIQQSNCRSCDRSLSKDWKYCPNCGEHHVIKCMKCGARLEPNWKICPHCNDQSRSDQLTSETERLYRAYCEAIWADHVVNADERDLLRRKRLELGLTEDKAEEIEKTVINPLIVQFIGLVEAVLIDNVIDENELEFLRGKSEKMEIPWSTAERLIENLRIETERQITIKS